MYQSREQKIAVSVVALHHTVPGKDYFCFLNWAAQNSSKYAVILLCTSS